IVGLAEETQKASARTSKGAAGRNRSRVKPAGRKTTARKGAVREKAEDVKISSRGGCGYGHQHREGVLADEARAREEPDERNDIQSSLSARRRNSSGRSGQPALLPHNPPLVRRSACGSHRRPDLHAIAPGLSLCQ